MKLIFRHEKRKKDVLEVDAPEKFCDLLALEKELNAQGYWQDLTTPKITYGPIGGVGRNTDDTWKDVLRKIKAGSGRGNTIDV